MPAALVLPIPRSRRRCCRAPCRGHWAPITRKSDLVA